MPRPVSLLMELEGCTQAAIDTITPALRKVGLQTILTHAGVKAMYYDLREATVDEMLNMQDPHSDGTSGYGVLQPNTLYIYCEYDEGSSGVLSDLRRSELLRELRIKTPKFTPVQISLPIQHRYQRQYCEFPMEIHKDIVFLSEDEKKEIGFYNLHTNILWISDITHISNKFLPIIKEILDKVTQIRLTGRLQSKELTIGADPEFEIIDKRGNLLGASVFFGGGTEIGTDGHQETGELRPPHGRSPYHFMRNLKRTMRKLVNSTVLPTDARIMAGGGTKVSTGGHIHFGEKTYPRDLPKLLHKHVGQYVLACQTGRRNESTNTIREGGSDAVRPADAHTGWEWRSLPSWLVSEDIAQCIIVTSYAIAKASYTNTIPNIGETPVILRGLPLYKAYKDDIEEFIKTFVVPTVKKTKLEGVDCIPNWRISRKRHQYPITILTRHEKIKKYFSPVPCKLKNNVVVQIEYCGNSLVTYGLTSSAVSRMQRVADVHYVNHLPYENLDIMIKEVPDFQYLAQRRASAPYADVIVLMPAIWNQNEKGKERLFKRIGWIIQASIEEKEGI